MDDSVIIPTFLKWAGGKRRILPLLEDFFPKKINRYFEPFLGAGSVFFYIKEKYRPSYSMISDINEDLINTYRVVRDHPEELMKELSLLKAKKSSEFYYILRKKFNEHKLKEIKREAAFIFLNKTCYNGLFRVNFKNEFNVPYGKQKNPSIFDRDTILHASSLLQDVEIRHQDYREMLSYIKKNDFIYLDPCYDPIKRTSFVQYTPKTFSIEDRINLGKFVNQLSAQGAKVLLSNNDITEIRSMYEKLFIHEISAPRSIGSKSSKYHNTKELAISNYDQ